MKKSICLLMLSVLVVSFSALADPGAKPKLLVLISVDQLRGDMPQRLHERFGEGGFRVFLDEGMNFSNAHFRHATTFTASGHATLVTGGNPAEHWLVANDWFSREYNARVYALGDMDYAVVDGRRGPLVGTAPTNLRSSTIGDELYDATGGKAKVFSIGIKDRAAIAMGGFHGKALWYDPGAGRFTSSTYYYENREALPAWLQAWDSPAFIDELVGETPTWSLLHEQDSYIHGEHDLREFESKRPGIGLTFPHTLPKQGSRALYGAIRFTPYGDVVALACAKELIVNEALGQDEAPDFLALGLSCSDLIGHTFGPESLEVEDNLLQLDRSLADFFTFIDEKVGMENTVVVLSGDHGIPQIPEQRIDDQWPVGRVNGPLIKKKINESFQEAHGVEEDVVVEMIGPYVYLDEPMLAEMGLDLEAVEEISAKIALEVEGVRLALTRSAIAKGQLPDTELMDLVERSFYRSRFGNLFLIHEPFWLFGGGGYSTGTSHGSPYSYDRYVPVLFAGGGVPKGRVTRAVGPEDIAPTLAALLNIMAPSGSTGQVLQEVLD